MTVSAANWPSEHSKVKKKILLKLFVSLFLRPGPQFSFTAPIFLFHRSICEIFLNQMDSVIIPMNLSKY